MALGGIMIIIEGLKKVKNISAKDPCVLVSTVSSFKSPIGRFQGAR